MKKIIALTLAVLMLCALAACDNTNNGPTTTAPTAPREGYRFTLSGVELVPGAPFDPSKLPEADFVFEQPSCAGEGVDKVYNYGTVEVVAFGDSQSAVIYSIYLLDPNTATTEGLHLGDAADQVTAIYGDGAVTEDGELLTYVKGDTHLIILLENDAVSSIEYRMAD